MRVFVAGATGVIGQFLVPGLIAAGHGVTGSTRSRAKAGQLKDQGATPVIVDGLDREAGTRRFIAQSFIGWNNARSAGPVKTEQDPLDPRPLPGTT